MIRRLSLFALVALAAGAGCFGARQTMRSFYVLYSQGVDVRHEAPPIPGMVRVRNMDADSVYEKFQIVVRSSPYQLRYSEANVWAVKPHQMMSDLIARVLAESGTFSAVTRELIEARPDFTLSGKLLAAEVYDSDDLWFAHLAFNLHLSRFADGARLWSYELDARKPVPTRTFPHAVRALSELLQEALEEAVGELGALEVQPMGGPPAVTPRRSRREPPAPVMREVNPAPEPAILPEPPPADAP